MPLCVVLGEESNSSLPVNNQLLKMLFFTREHLIVLGQTRSLSIFIS